MSVTASADDENMKTSEGTRKIIEGGYTILASYGLTVIISKAAGGGECMPIFINNNIIRRNDKESPPLHHVSRNTILVYISCKSIMKVRG
jgi:hypothetical protein